MSSTASGSRQPGSVRACRARLPVFSDSFSGSCGRVRLGRRGGSGSWTRSSAPMQVVAAALNFVTPWWRTALPRSAAPDGAGLQGRANPGRELGGPRLKKAPDMRTLLWRSSSRRSSCRRVSRRRQGCPCELARRQSALGPRTVLGVESRLVHERKVSTTRSSSWPITSTAI